MYLRGETRGLGGGAASERVVAVLYQMVQDAVLGGRGKAPTCLMMAVWASLAGSGLVSPFSVSGLVPSFESVSMAERGGQSGGAGRTASYRSGGPGINSWSQPWPAQTGRGGTAALPAKPHSMESPQTLAKLLLSDPSPPKISAPDRAVCESFRRISTLALKLFTDYRFSPA